MISKDSSVTLSYYVVGEHLVKAGIYSVAEVKVTNSFKDNEKFELIERSKTIEPPKFKYSTQNTTLGSQFVAMALELPIKPKKMSYHKWLRSSLGKFAQEFKKLTKEQKITFHVEQYVEAMGGQLINFEIL